MKIRRDDLLAKLELVQFGVAQRETVPQSKCFCFRAGQVMAYDDEVLCRTSSGLNGSIHGAVEAKQLLDLLRKVPDAELAVEQSRGVLLIHGKRKKGTFNMESEVNLPVDQVEQPGAWTPLPPEFGDAMALVQECAKDKHGTFCRTCIHITSKYLQAYDGRQMVRYKLRTPIQSESILVRKEAIKRIVSLGMTEFSESEHWVHFRNAKDLLFSCRRWLEEYPELSPYFKTSGEVITLPKGLDEIIDRAQVATQQLADAERIKVIIKPGRLDIIGIGVTCKYEENRPLKEHKGRSYAFLISPTLLADVAKKHQEAELTESTLIVRGSGWTYLAGLVNPDDVDDETQPSSEDDIPEDEPVEDEDEDNPGDE